MRFELHLILWVTAAVSLSAVLFHGTVGVAEISMSGATSVGHQRSLQVEAVEQGAIKTTEMFPRPLPDVSQHTRRLFNIVAELQPVETAAPTVSVEPGLPMLKGVVSGVDGLRAVFAMDATSADYIVAGPGDSVAGYRIEDVAADRVSAVSAGGDDVTFNLRGAGEHP